WSEYVTSLSQLPGISNLEQVLIDARLYRSRDGSRARRGSPNIRDEPFRGHYYVPDFPATPYQGEGYYCADWIGRRDNPICIRLCLQRL
ncbi:unnamed protein product, partial [Penicillium nalgiovense]